MRMFLEDTKRWWAPWTWFESSFATIWVVEVNDCYYICTSELNVLEGKQFLFQSQGLMAARSRLFQRPGVRVSRSLISVGPLSHRNTLLCCSLGGSEQLEPCGMETLLLSSPLFSSPFLSSTLLPSVLPLTLLFLAHSFSPPGVHSLLKSDTPAAASSPSSPRREADVPWHQPLSLRSPNRVQPGLLSVHMEAISLSH